MQISMEYISWGSYDFEKSDIIASLLIFILCVHEEESIFKEF